MIVLVTGASGGLGEVLCTTLSEQGHTVYGTMRKPDTEATYPCHMLAMEVTDETSVQSCVDQIVEWEGQLDAVINCVNLMMIGAVEEAAVTEVEALYQTNVFGVMRICQAVLPQMRRQGAGTIVNMSSLGGLLAVPLMSSYTSAKFALEAYSEALHLEVKADGIDVVIMQPVAMYMDRPATGHHLQLAQGVTADSPSHKMVAVMAKDTADSKLTPQLVAAKICSVLAASNKPLRVPMDRARVIGLLKRIVPTRVIHKLVLSLTQQDVQPTAEAQP